MQQPATTRQRRSKTADWAAWAPGRPTIAGRSSSPGAASSWCWARSRRSLTGRCPAPAGRRSARSPWPRVTRSRPTSPGAARTPFPSSSPVRARARRIRPWSAFRPCSAATPRCRACFRRGCPRDGTTAVVVGLAGADPSEMVEAAGRLKTRLTAALDSRRHGPPHRARRDVVGLQRRQQGGDAQVRGAVLAAHPRAAAVRLRDAGRGRPAAAADDGRPPRRGRAAVPGRAVRRRLDLGHELRADVRDRARDRLRALHRRPLPLRARGRPGAARRDGAHDGDRGQGRA